MLSDMFFCKFVGLSHSWKQWKGFQDKTEFGLLGVSTQPAHSTVQYCEPLSHKLTRNRSDIVLFTEVTFVSDCLSFYIGWGWGS